MFDGSPLTALEAHNAPTLPNQRPKMIGSSALFPHDYADPSYRSRIGRRTALGLLLTGAVPAALNGWAHSALSMTVTTYATPQERQAGVAAIAALHITYEDG